MGGGSPQTLPGAGSQEEQEHLEKLMIERERERERDLRRWRAGRREDDAYSDLGREISSENHR